MNIKVNKVYKSYLTLDRYLPEEFFKITANIRNNIPKIDIDEIKDDEKYNVLMQQRYAFTIPYVPIKNIDDLDFNHTITFIHCTDILTPEYSINLQMASVEPNETLEIEWVE